jgi:hypothetical protein
MSVKKKLAILVLAGILMVNIASSQKAVPLEILSSVSQTNDSNLLQYGLNKQLPPGYEKEVLEALSYFPELKKVKIKFVVKKSLSTLKTKPTFVSVFLPRGHRSYIITISNKTIDKLTPVMFANLPEEARIGIAGHELSHVADLSSRTTWQCFKVGMGHLSPRYLDRFEYNTDLICIKHGLGKNLEAWSSYIRNTMHTVFWRGAGYVNKGDMGYERYMNPLTLKRI